MNPYRVVEDFEAALADYTGAPFVVSVNSCSSALLLALSWWKREAPEIETLIFPSKTYCSAPMAAIHAGYRIRWISDEWTGEYPINPLPVWDSARRFRRGMFRPGMMQCISFQTSKILGIEQGGAILHDNAQADEWLLRARFDGRRNAQERLPAQIGYHCYLNPSTAALGLSRLSCLPDFNEDNGGSHIFEDLSKLPIW